MAVMVVKGLNAAITQRFHAMCVHNNLLWYSNTYLIGCIRTLWAHIGAKCINITH